MECTHRFKKIQGYYVCDKCGQPECSDKVKTQNQTRKWIAIGITIAIIIIVGISSRSQNLGV